MHAGSRTSANNLSAFRTKISFLSLRSERRYPAGSDARRRCACRKSRAADIDHDPRSTSRGRGRHISCASGSQQRRAQVVWSLDRPTRHGDPNPATTRRRHSNERGGESSSPLAVAAAQRAARLRAGARVHAAVPLADRADPAVGHVLQDGHARLGGVLGHRHRAARARLAAPVVRRVADRRRDQRGLRPAGGLGAGALSLSGPAHRRCAGRSAVRAADRGGRHRADRGLREQRLDRQPARAARHQGRLHAAGRGGGADLHRPAVRGAHRAAGAGGPRAGAGGGRGDAWARTAGRRSRG